MPTLKQNLVIAYLTAKHIWPENFTESIKNMAINVSDCMPILEKPIIKVFHFDNDRRAVVYLIQQYTYNNANRDGDINQIIKYVKKDAKDYVTEIEEKDDLLNIRTTDGLIQVGKLTDSISDNELKETLQTRDRVGCCHVESICTGLRFQDDSSVVTGKIWEISPVHKILHSWLEIPREGKDDLVVDYTLNAVMQKSGYYKLHHVDENKINRVSINEILQDANYVDNYTCEYTYLLKEYLMGKKEKARKLYEFGGELKDDDLPISNNQNEMDK